MTALYTVADFRALEQHLFATRPSFDVMQQAGNAVAQAAMTQLPDQTATVLAVAGGGNNGGDAIIAATILQQAGYNATLLLCADRDTLPADAARALAHWHNSGNHVLTLAAICDAQNRIQALPEAALIIDGLFGIGLSRAPQGLWQALITAINNHPAPTVAIDIPSGVYADSGDVPTCAVQAQKTITFLGAKPGLYTGAGCAHSGAVDIVPLNAPPHPARGNLLSPPAMQTGLRHLRRDKNSHKGDFRTVALIGGASGMLGALVLAARAAARLGAGKTLACSLAENCPAVDWLSPDIMWRPIRADSTAGAQTGSSTSTSSDACISADCIAIGMGLGTSQAAAACLHQYLDCAVPLLIDADGLTVLAKNSTRWQARVSQRTHPTILTPHAGEAARLLHKSSTDINRNRLAAAAEISQRWQATVVLKGAGSIIQSPGRTFELCSAGNPGLARGGSGDILSGIIVALLAQTADAHFAACVGTWLHATAADQLAQQHGELAVNINQLAETAAIIASTASESRA